MTRGYTCVVCVELRPSIGGFTYDQSQTTLKGLVRQISAWPHGKYPYDQWPMHKGLHLIQMQKWVLSLHNSDFFYFIQHVLEIFCPFWGILGPF
jgi:hypothetical protein